MATVEARGKEARNDHIVTVAKEQPVPAQGGKRNALWTVYGIQFNFLTRLCGSVPGDPELVKAWVAARTPAVKPPGGKSIDEIQEEVFASLAEPVESEQFSMLVFQRDSGHIVMRSATFRAHMKDCARVLSAQWIGRIKGERSFSTRVINGLYLDPKQYWIPVLRPDGEKIVEHDGEQDKAIHVRGPRGELINALKRFQWIQPARIDFKLLVLGNSVSLTDLEHLFHYGGVHGYGGERGDGEGRYWAEITKLGEEN